MPIQADSILLFNFFLQESQIKNTNFCLLKEMVHPMLFFFSTYYTPLCNWRSQFSAHHSGSFAHTQNSTKVEVSSNHEQLLPAHYDVSAVDPWNIPFSKSFFLEKKKKKLTAVFNHTVLEHTKQQHSGLYSDTHTQSCVKSFQYIQLNNKQEHLREFDLSKRQDSACWDPALCVAPGWSCGSVKFPQILHLQGCEE